MKLIDNITLLSIILTGAALIREREHGTVEHLLVMPVTPFEIMTAKVWAMALVVLAATICSLIFVVEGVIGVPIEGSIPLFIAGTALHLFATAARGSRSSGRSSLPSPSSGPCCSLSLWRVSGRPSGRWRDRGGAFIPQ